METRRDGGQAQPDYSGLQVVDSEYGTAPAGYSNSDYSGLQAVHHGPDAPEAVLSNSLPEAVPAEYKSAPYYEQPPLIPYSDPDDAPELSEVHKADEASVAPAGHKQPWWKRKRWIIAIITVLILIIVGAVVGAVVGTRSDNSDTSTPTPANSGNNNSPVSNQTTQRSACRDQVCPQILASASIGAWTSSASILLFARGVDNAIWYTSAAASALSPSWPTSSSSQKWQSLASVAGGAAGGGGPYLSQPSALTWGNGTRASVFALSDPSHMVHTLKFTGDSDDQYRTGEWEVLGGPALSPISACSLNGSRPDLWSSADSNVLHDFGVSAPDFDDGWSVSPDKAWTRDVDFGTKIASGARPGVVCRTYPFMHDVVVYGADDGAVRHSQYSKATSWTPPSNRGGKFAGEPVVVEVTGDRLDFFGIGQEDRHMYHFTWTKDGGYTPLEDVGGSFQSVPSAAVTGSGARVDVVALGTNDRLQHRVLQGLKWTSEWEDLGVFGNSAPLLVNITNTQPEKVALFVVGVNGEVNQTTWTASSELSWRSLVWKGMGGNMTTDFYKS